LAYESDITIGIVGARGHVGSELIKLIDQHPHLRLSFAASRSLIGKPIPGKENVGMAYVDADPIAAASLEADAVILAVPDGATGGYVDALGDSLSKKVILDLSSDHRFDDRWVYGLSEFNEQALRGASRISNPGCYATAVQLALGPVIDLIDGAAHAFGVSGYSGAGTTPSPRNDPAVLDGGISPYKLIGHTHEREISRHLGQPIRFSPHVAPFFRGITVTVQAQVKEIMSASALIELFESSYKDSNLIRVIGEDIPRVQEIVNDPGAEIGGITIGENGKDIALVCTIDNLLKGAASQAIQNLNLAFGLESELGLIAQGVSA